MKVGFISTQDFAAFGGSEVLWCQVAGKLLDRGRTVCINYQVFDPLAPTLAELGVRGAEIFLRRDPGRLRRRLRRVTERLGRVVDEHYGPWLDRTRPDVVLVSLAFHAHDLRFVAALRARGIPYLLLLQSINPAHWIHRDDVASFRAAYIGATANIFLSPYNRQCIEDQLGLAMPRVHYTANPADVDGEIPLPWPDIDREVRLACVARLHPPSKGQDIAIRVLASEKWRSRSVRLGIFGEDAGYERRLRELVDRLELTQSVSFHGRVEGVRSVWDTHHALLLPSRFEGAPLVTNEAMLCGRVPIVTRDWNAQIVTDGQTGFLATGASVWAFDAALERAWAERKGWEQMGLRAAEAAREYLSPEPAEQLASLLDGLA
jgi:glycosyltransferase involved in cell wall biosynthesis